MIDLAGNTLALIGYLSLTIIITNMIFGDDDNHKY
jgi:hypothetical protein